MLKTSLIFLIGLVATELLAAELLAADEPADSIYLNATVLTLDSQRRVAEGLAIRGDRIVAVGNAAELRKLAGAKTAIHDLGGKTVTPGFYAAHDHFPGSGRMGLLTADLNSPPIGSIRSMPDLIAALKQEAQRIPRGQWVTGRGYDDTLLHELRHPTRGDLDQASSEHPIWITHVSGHLGVANSRALELARISRDTPQPAGGRIHFHARTGEPTGVIEESLGLVTRLIPASSQEDQLRATQAAVEQYVRQGVTTAVIAGGSARSIEHLMGAIKLGIVKFRIVAMTSGGPETEARKAIEAFASPLLKPGAIKLLQDGSIQGFTGYLSRPYFVPGERDPSYRGYSLRSRQSLTERVQELHRAGYQIAIHGNGDEAIDDILHAFAEAQRSLLRADARHRIEHCQTVRDDQLDRMKSLGVTPSFFVGHVYYWGDRHREIFLGPERAARISPLASAIQRGLRFTLHDDTPVTPVNPLQLIWVGANRLTTGGRILGPEQRIGVEQALRAVTAEAAWQNFEESEKGTLEPGKLADFCVLSENPLAIAATSIREIKVVETVVGGQLIFRAR